MFLLLDGWFVSGTLLSLMLRSSLGTALCLRFFRQFLCRSLMCFIILHVGVVYIAALNIFLGCYRLDVYIHDYLVKRDLKATAQAFQAEGKVSSDPVGKKSQSSRPSYYDSDNDSSFCTNELCILLALFCSY